MDEVHGNVGGDNPSIQIVDAQPIPQLAQPSGQPIIDNNEPNNQAIVILDDEVAEGSHLRESNENVPDIALTPNRKKRRRSSPTKKMTPTKIADDLVDDDGATCPICLETWEMSSGEHRLVSLKCGHLFGDTCIKRWIKECPPNMKTCPTCKSKAQIRDIRQLYAKKIVAVDKSEEYRLQNLLDSEKKKSSELQNNVSKLQIELTLLRERTERLENQLEYAKVNGIAIDGASSSNSTLPKMYKLSLEKTMEINRDPGCRAMIYGRRSQSLFVSQKSSQTLFPGWGVRFFNVDGFILSNNFLHMTIKQIRDLSLDRDEELIVSASMDNSVKMYSIPNKCPVSVFTPSDKPIWSCAFDCVRQKYLYLGSQNGSTYAYDIRSPHNYVQEHKTLGDLCPVVSICPVPYNEQLPFGGFITCKLQSMWFYEYTASQDVIPHKLMIDGPFVSVNYDERTKQLLISTRPSSKHATTRYIIADLIRVDQNIALRQSITINGSKTQKVMTRSAQMKVLDDVVVAAYLEDTKQLTTWNTRKNTMRMQALPVGDTIYDTCPLYIDQKGFLAALSETRLRLYQVNVQ